MILRLDNGMFLESTGDVPVTVQSVDIGDLSSRFVNSTTSIKLPPTGNNKRFFEFATQLQSTTDIIYTSIGCTLLDKGIELFSGYLVIIRVEEFIHVQVMDRTINFYKQIENLSLRDLDFGDSPVSWTASYIDSRRAATSGIVCPVLDYGQFDPSGSSIGDYYLPSVALDTIIQAIIENAGYSITGDVLSNEHYTSAIMAYSYNGWPGTSFTMNQIMPDIQQMDLMKWLLVAFGAVLIERGNNELTIHRFEDILADTQNSVDWTRKRVNIPDKISFVYGRYAQQNKFIAKTPYSDDSFTSGTIEIDNPQLSAENEVYKSPILVADDGLQVNSDADFIWCAVLLWWAEGNLPAGFPPTTPFDKDPEPVILLTRERYTTEPDVEYDGTPRNDYRVAYGSYLKIGSNVINPLSTEWSSSGRTGLLDINYPNLSRSLNRLRVIERFYNLTINDVYNFDVSKLVFDVDSYFMVTKIDKFISGRKTKVQMIARTFGEIPNIPQEISVNAGSADLTITGYAPNITVVT